MTSPEPRAVIDIGSHSVLLLAAGGPKELPEVLLHQYRITALGAGMDMDRRIQTDAAQRTRKTIEEYLSQCQTLGIGDVRLDGTCALREAGNRNETLEILSGSKKDTIQVLSEAQEAALTRAGALSGLKTSGPDDRAVVADLGGRSTEVTWAGFSRSTSLGCQRATDSYLTSDPPQDQEIARLDEHLSTELAGLPAPPGGGRLICSGGTATTLASMDLALFAYRAEAIHGHVLGCQRLDQQARQLMSLPLSERRTLTGLDPDRAPVIPAGAMILHRLCAWHGSGEVLISARGLTWGVWMDGAGFPES